MAVMEKGTAILVLGVYYNCYDENNYSIFPLLQTESEAVEQNPVACQT